MAQGPAGLPGWRRAPGERAAEVRLVEATAPHADAVVAMLARCSRMTLYHRFHGFADGVAYSRALLADPTAHETLLAWSCSSCIGMATLTLGVAGPAHLGVLLEDAWQRRGLGTRLVGSLLGAARMRSIAAVHADILSEDRFILEILRRMGPLTVSSEGETLSVDIDLGRSVDRDRSGTLGSIAGA